MKILKFREFIQLNENQSEQHTYFILAAMVLLNNEDLEQKLSEIFPTNNISEIRKAAKTIFKFYTIENTDELVAVLKEQIGEDEDAALYILNGYFNETDENKRKNIRQLLANHITKPKNGRKYMTYVCNKIFSSGSNETNI